MSAPRMNACHADEFTIRITSPLLLVTMRIDRQMSVLAQQVLKLWFACHIRCPLRMPFMRRPFVTSSCNLLSDRTQANSIALRVPQTVALQFRRTDELCFGCGLLLRLWPCLKVYCFIHGGRNRGQTDGYKLHIFRQDGESPVIGQEHWSLTAFKAVTTVLRSPRDGSSAGLDFEGMRENQLHVCPLKSASSKVRRSH